MKSDVVKYSTKLILPNAEIIMKLYDEAITEFLNEEPVVVDPSLPEGIKLLLRALENPNNLPFARELWNYSLPEYIARVKEPILVVIGKKISNRLENRRKGILENATNEKIEATFAYPENANHVLKYEELPIERLTAQYVGSHYNAPDARLDEESRNDIFDWLDGQRNKSA